MCVRRKSSPIARNAFTFRSAKKVHRSPLKRLSARFSEFFTCPIMTHANAGPAEATTCDWFCVRVYQKLFRLNNLSDWSTLILQWQRHKVVHKNECETLPRPHGERVHPYPFTNSRKAKKNSQLSCRVRHCDAHIQHLLMVWVCRWFCSVSPLLHAGFLSIFLSPFLLLLPASCYGQAVAVRRERGTRVQLNLRQT